MKIQLSLKEIKKSYEEIKKSAIEEFNKGNLQLSLNLIDQAAVLAQQFNWIYSDDELEDLLQKISITIFTETKSNYLPIENRVVFFDDFCTSFVLALQYLKALVAHNATILYITGREISPSSKFAHILDTIKDYPRLTVKVIPQNINRLTRIREIYNTIIEFYPTKILLHITAKSICIPVLYSLPKSITKYIINLADQTFWLGSKGVDYSFEFRQFGATVSYEKRGLRREQLIFLPFYPIVDNNPFQGFPNEVKDKVIIFSGGDFYKTIDPENTYWNLVKSVLNENSNAVFLFATKVDNSKTQDFIDMFIKDNDLENRFIYIGFRPDINEVFKHCDIFMGTNPASGSLMSQLAAFNSKPFLQFYLPDTPDDETEAAICHNRFMQISFTDESKFLAEAKRLVEDVNYRIEKGKEINACMLTENQFNTRFSKFLETNSSYVELKEGLIDYSALTNRWYWIEYMGFIDTIQYLYSVLGPKKCFNKVRIVWFKYNFRKYIQTKLFSLKWFKYKLTGLIKNNKTEL